MKHAGTTAGREPRHNEPRSMWPMRAIILRHCSVAFYRRTIMAVVPLSLSE